MCDFFTCIVTIAGDVLFTEKDSHETLIYRTGFKDDLKHFVRIEYTPDRGYIIDENSIPEWYERMAAKATRDVKATYKKFANDHKIMIHARLKGYNEYYAFCKDSIGANMAWDFKEWKIYCDREWAEFERTQRLLIKEYKDKIKKVKGYICPLS